MAEPRRSLLHIKAFIFWNASTITKSGQEPTNPVKPQMPPLYAPCGYLGPHPAGHLPGVLRPRGLTIPAFGFFLLTLCSHDLLKTPLARTPIYRPGTRQHRTNV